MANKRYLDIVDGAAIIIEVDDSGQEVSRKAASTAEALGLIENVVQEPEHFRIRGGGAQGDPTVLKRVIARHALAVILIHGADLERQGKTEQDWVDSVRDLLRDPGTLSYLKQYAESGIDARGSQVIARIWPQLVDPDPPPADPSAPPDPNATPGDVAMAGGTNQGATPLPEAKPGGNGSGKVPPSGRPGSATGTGGGMTPDGAHAADPVLPASGQLVLEETDLEVEGIGLDLRLERYYLHNVDYVGTLGPKWDHSYNLWLREAVEPLATGGFRYVVYRSSGRLTADKFVFEGDLAAPADFRSVSDGVFLPPDGTHERLVKIADRFVLESPDGHRIFYNEHLRAESLQDLNGNRIALRYADDAFTLSEIVDTCGRVYRLAYDAGGRLARILDTALDREIAYAYDGQGRLIAVRHSTGDPDQPHRFKGYRYWGDDAPPGMAGNIVAVVDPRGVEVLQVRYGTEHGMPSYNRVVEQRNGTVLTIEYEFLYEPGTSSADLPTTAPAVRVRLRDREGGSHDLDYNSQGRMVRHAVLEPSLTGITPVETRWEYNADGRVIREDRPGGGATDYEYGRERFAALGGDPSSATADERLRFGNLRKITERPRPGVPGPPQRITEFDYHPDFGFIVEQRGPYYADSMGLRIDAGPPFTFRAVYDSKANLVRLEYPDCTEPDGTLQSGRRVELARDGRGRLTERALPLDPSVALTTAYEYPPDGDPACAHPSAEILDSDSLALRRMFSSDPAGRTIRVDESSGQIVTREFDHLGRVLSEEISSHVPGGMPSRMRTEWAPHDHPSRIVQNRVDSNGLEDIDGLLEQTFTFDAEGEVQIARTRSGDLRIDRESRHEQSGSGGRLTSVTAGGVEARFLYDARGLLLEQIISAEGTEPTRYSYSYDEEGLLSRLEDSGGRTEEIRYDGFGRMAERTAGDITEEFQWDAADRLVSRTVRGPHPDRTAPVVLRDERRELNEAGQLRRLRIAVFDPASASTVADWAETELFYDRADRLRRVEGPGGSFREYEYDGLGRATRCADASGNVESWSYDDAGRRVTHEITLTAAPPLGPPWHSSFRTVERMDTHGNVVERVDPLGNRFRYEWDSRGNLTAIEDPAGVRREEDPEPDGQLRRVVVAKGMPEELSWEYRRDRFGQIVGIEGPRGEIASIVRDGRGRAVQVRYGPPALSEPTTYEYDSVGRIARSKDGRGVQVQYDYGPAGLPVRISYDRSAVVTPPGIADYFVTGPARTELRYDGAGQLVEADDGRITVSRRYDSRGDLLRESVDGTTVAWSYDLAGRVLSFTYPDGRRLRYDRDTGGRVRRLTEETTSSVDPGAPAPGGVLLERVPWGLTSAISETWRGTVERQEIPDGAGRLLRISDRRVDDGTSLFESVQISDERGLPRIRQAASGGRLRTEVITSDGQARVVRVARSDDVPLADVTSLGPEQSATQAEHKAAADAVASTLGPAREELVLDLAPDSCRERLRHSADGTTVSDVGYLADGVGRITAVDGAIRRYDGEGMTVLADAKRFEHDVSRRLTSVTDAGVPVFSCTRDPLGRVHRLSVNGSDFRLVHDGARVVEVRDQAGPVAQFVRDFSTGFLVETGRNGASFLALRDFSGSIVGAVDASGVVVSEARYDPFGGVEALLGQSTDPEFGFQSLLRLPGTPSYLTHARTYDSSTGTFFEPDPADFIDGPNRYLAARGNPYVFRDEWGLSAQGTGKSGRGGGTGTHNQHGVGSAHAEDRELRWYERAFLAMAGAVGAVIDMVIVEPAKQISDMAGLGISAFGIATGWYEFDYQVKSGIGHASQQGKGTLGIFKDIGRNIVEAPGRVWRAAEEGDYYQFGAEAMNLYTIGRSVHGVARGSASWAFNRGVNVLGRLGPSGEALRYHIRTWQVNRLASKSMKILGPDATRPGVKYDASLPPGEFGAASVSGSGLVSIGESAFTPGLRALWPDVGGFKAFRLRVGNVLRGNLKLRTMVHEINHYNQYLHNPVLYEALGPSSPGYSYLLDPYEFTQFRGSPITGSWNLEMSVPAGPFAAALAGATVGNNLVDPEGPRTNAP